MDEFLTRNELDCIKSFHLIGYKLGFNYLKAKRFVDAIDVCHKVCFFCFYSDQVKFQVL